MSLKGLFTNVSIGCESIEFQIHVTVKFQKKT